MALFTRKILRHASVNPERFALEWASAAEAPLYVDLISKFTERIKELGPLGKAEGIAWEDLEPKLSAAKAAAMSIKLRTRLAKLTQDLREEKDYAIDTIEAKLEGKLDHTIRSEMERQESRIRNSEMGE
jgi:hypothetical protein